MKLLNDLVQNGRRSALITGSLALLSIGFSVSLAWSGQVKLVGPAYLISSLLIGGWLYASASPLYLGLVIWLWLVTSFARRVIDYAVLNSYTPPSQSLVMLAPFAVTSLTLFDIPRFGKNLFRRKYLPCLLCALGVTYGYIVGLIKVGVITTTMSLVGWLPPLFIGFYVLNRRHLANRHVQVAKNTVKWGVLMLGSYAILQFYFLPEWDAFWMRSVEMKSIGHPYPQEVRVFSMLDSPGPFAVAIGAGLILLFTERGILSVLAAVPGYIGFLLSSVRGAWIGWVVGMGTIFIMAQNRVKVRLLGVAAAVAIFTIPIAMTGSIADRTGGRMQTLSKGREIGSLQARLHLYGSAPIQIAQNPIGWGLGSRNMDSGILALFWQLGWTGAILYLSGVALLLRNLIQTQTTLSVFTIGLFSYFFIQFFAGMSFLGQVKGVIFWIFMAIPISKSSSY